MNCLKWTAASILAALSSAPAMASEPRAYLETQVEAYEQAIERCEEKIKERALPSDELLQRLKQYELKQVRVFLITRANQLQSQCERPELTELSYAIGTLERLDLSEETGERLSSVANLLYTPSPWRFREQYESLPESLRETLKSEPYFQKPFNAVAILEAMEAR